MVIYKTTNKLNGKIYVGQDCHNNEVYLGSGDILRRAIKKYGRSNFKKEVLEVCDTKEQLNLREIYWIDLLQATDLEKGYNIRKGGQGALPGQAHPLFGKFRSEESKKLQSIATSGERNHNYGIHLSTERRTAIRNYRLGRHHKLESLEKIRLASSGENNPNYGKKHSCETMQRIVAATSGEKNRMYGKKHDDITLEKMRISALLREERKRLLRAA